MVADGVHILLAVAVTMLVVRSDDAVPYLIAILAGGFPDLDMFVFQPLVYRGYVEGVMWGHRGLTHSIFALAVFVGIWWLMGHPLPALLGYGSHLSADAVTGGVRLFAPLSPTIHGIYLDWALVSGVLGLFSMAVIVVGSMWLIDVPFERQLRTSRPVDLLDGRRGEK